MEYNMHYFKVCCIGYIVQCTVKFTGLISSLMIVGFGKKPKHLRSKTWDATNGRDSPSSPSPSPGTNGKKGAVSYAPKKDRESFRSALVNIIM